MALTTFATLKKGITQAHNIIFEDKIDKLEKEPVYSFLGMFEEGLKKNNTEVNLGVSALVVVVILVKVKEKLFYSWKIGKRHCFLKRSSAN